MDLQQNILNWLKSLKGWQTELAYRLLAKSNLEDADIDDIISMLKNGGSFEDKAFPNLGMSFVRQPVTLLSIDSIENIEQLSPRNPLKFAERGITVVYGNNGTGKSGYARILKKLCGKPHGRDLIGNIYNPNDRPGKCCLSFKNEEQIEQIEWTMNGSAIDSLMVVDIFDTDTGWSYLKDANTVSYIPPIIAFFTSFSKNHDLIKARLTTEKETLNPKLPAPPLELSNTTFIKRTYQAINLDITKFTWTDDNENELLSLEQKLKEVDFQKAAQEKRVQKRKIDLLIKDINDAAQKVTQRSKDEIESLAQDVAVKEQAVLDAGKALKDISQLDGIGTESWKRLWQAAKEYALCEAYKNDNKLHQHERCVLCNRLLDREAKERLQCFDSFITNELAKEAAATKQRYEERINALPTFLSQETIDDKCIASGLDRDWGNQIFHIWSQICNNGVAIRDRKPIADIAIEVNTALSALREKSRRYEEEATKYEADAKLFDRNTTTNQLLELKAQKWATEQLESIKAEKARQGLLAEYERWISQTNTRGITIKATEVGDAVISQGFVDRFNAELQKLGANNICVEFIKQTYKGTTRHALKIANATHDNPVDILSEGEARIVALAAFLADVTGCDSNNPFIFDDPISSLDQTYEEKTVKRLVELSENRQVIVFTHRLSLLGQLIELTDGKITTECIRKEHWGTGEIGETPLFAKRPDKALKNIAQEKLTKVQKIYEQQGQGEYYPYGKMICSDLRILIERIVEIHLLADIVQRYRLAVNTKGKVEKLAKINSEDCAIINRFMTKYSYYEHSQPLEAPIEIPTPCDIKKDIDELLSWLDEFSKRE